jgi:hypothetical protein
VEGPPFPRGTTWSISSRTSEPQTPPDATGHWHFPSSRFTTSRFTLAGTDAFLFPCFSMSSSRAARSTCSSVAPGCTCDCPAFALFSSARNSGETVMCIRLSFGVRGWISVRLTASNGANTCPFVTLPGWVRTSSIVEPTPPPVTTVLFGTTSAGRNSAATCLASWRERPKNLGRTSCRFSSVITFATSMTVVVHNRPSRSGSTISGNRSTSLAATCR